MTAEADAAQRDSFPIVAVGASAGGLAPTAELLRELGRELQIAIVIIHHLDATHESSLVEILSRATRMPVAAATDGVRVEPGHVYVIPPNAGLLITQGTLRLVPRHEEGGLHLPIDRFFESLALDCDGLAVGVVLSGSGFDGTAGVKAIKRAGGIALAQDGTAQYASMPQSAIATGCVDFILPPAGLARELRRISLHAPSSLAVPPHGAEEPEFPKILAALQKASGVDFTGYRTATIGRRLQRRLVLLGITELSAYVELLEREPAEIGMLIEDVLVHVTGFFREPEAFEALRTQVFPKLCERRPRDAAIRVWVPGCSTGEEVYSIAICLLEFLAATHRDVPVKIFGTDLSLGIIATARAARYPESIERDVSPGRLQRFFWKDESGYQIRRDVRDLCVFAKHDVTRDPPFSGMDFISCRNLMIYLGVELQNRLIALLHYALKEPGFLALGSSETVRAFTGFVTVDGKHKIYARTSAVPRLALDFTTGRVPSDFASRDLALPDSPYLAGARSPDIGREADRLVLEEFAPPGVVVTSDLAIVQFRGQTGPFLEPTPGAASLDLLRLAREELRLPLRRAIEQARAKQSPAREANVALLVGDTRRTVTVEVIPFAVHASQQRFFLVLFHELKPPESAAHSPAETPPADADRATEPALRQELASTRHYLESVIEQLEATNEELKAANEEIVSSNEELRSTNEELQSAKEELQATNEELRTLNDELHDRNLEATRLSDDLTNVLSSVDIPIVILGRDSCVRRFTPAAGRVLGLVGADIGRSIGDLRPLIAIAPALARLVPDALEQLRAFDGDVQDAEGRWHRLSVRPYVTLAGRIDGTVLAAFDIDAAKRATERVSASRAYAESIVDTVREGLAVLDRELRVSSTNTAFRRSFRLSANDIEGRRLDELGCPELAAPLLRALLEGLRGNDVVEGFRVAQADSGDSRVFLLNARRIEDTDSVLLAFDDVTDAERAQVAAQLSFRDALTAGAGGVLMFDETGRVLFVNRAAATLFGYQSEELTGSPVDRLLPEGLREIHAKHRASYAAAPSPPPMGRGRDLVGRRKDGSDFPVEVELGTVSREGGRVVVAFVTDVSERRAAENEIRSYQDRLQRAAFDAVLTEERERRRIAIELHDRVGQALALAEIKLTSVRADLSGATRASVDAAVELLHQAIGGSRTLVFELSPPILYDLGLKEALAWLAEDVEKRHGISIEVADDGESKPLDDGAKALIYRAVRELLMNVLRHSKAPSAKVSLRRSGDDLVVDVEDRGVGFDPDAPAERPSEGFGLVSVREQVTRLGGALEVQSAPEQGTLASIRVPLQPSASAREQSTDEPSGGERTP